MTPFKLLAADWKPYSISSLLLVAPSIVSESGPWFAVVFLSGLILLVRAGKTDQTGAARLLVFTVGTLFLHWTSYALWWTEVDERVFGIESFQGIDPYSGPAVLWWVTLSLAVPFELYSLWRCRKNPEISSRWLTVELLGVSGQIATAHHLGWMIDGV